MPDPRSPFSSKHPRPLALTIAAAIVGLQAAGMVLIAVWVWLPLLGGGGGEALTSFVALGVLMLVLGGALLFVARALWRGYRWPRSAAVAWQLLAGIVGVTLITGSVVWGLALIVPNIVVLVCLFTPKALAATERAVERQEPNG